MQEVEEMAVIATPMGRIAIHASEEGITGLEIHDVPRKVSGNRSSEAVEACKQALQHYFKNAHFHFNLRLKPAGTQFQQRVWRELQKIPVGQVRTYGEIARRLHSSARAVGGACRANPIPIIIPCHRVVSANGAGGYSGKTSGPELETKRFLLRHEGVTV